MKKLILVLIGLVSFVGVVGSASFVLRNPKTLEYGKNLAAVFFQESKTIGEVYKKYDQANRKVNVLVVPGHEPRDGGAKFGTLKERDMAVDLGNYLNGYLTSNSHYQTTLTRDKSAWNPVFSNYFKNNWEGIITFVDAQKKQMKSYVSDGQIQTISGAYHANAPKEMALRLYGINKWANENDIDIEVHIHFNDYPRVNKPIGKYTGLMIYVPERQFSNGTTSRAIAEKVLARLSKYNAISDQPKEVAGVVEDQELIALGSNNTTNAASILIEYGYIYEPQFQDPKVRDLVLKDLAYQTYLGLEDFFEGDDSKLVGYDTLVLPYNFEKNLAKNSKEVTEVFALQSALIVEGEYPTDQTKNECPRSGTFGNCTVKALTSFQKKYNIKGETGIVGSKTREILNSKYGS